MVLVNKQAPDFTTAAVLANGKIVEDFNFYKNINNKYALLFFYPLDFTFVCPSELIALNNRMALFTERNVEVIGASIDSQYTHNAWRNTPVEKGGIGELKFTLISDLNHNITKSYGIEHPEVGVALRATFLIDIHKNIMHQTVNSLPLGRNVDEFLRLIDALQFHEQHGEVCPAGWSKGSKSMKPTPDGVAAYLEEQAKSL